MERIIILYGFLFFFMDFFSFSRSKILFYLGTKLLLIVCESKFIKDSPRINIDDLEFKQNGSIKNQHIFFLDYKMYNSNPWIKHIKSEMGRLKIPYQDAIKDKRVRDSYESSKIDTLESAKKPIKRLRQKGKLVVGTKTRVATIDEDLEEMDQEPLVRKRQISDSDIAVNEKKNPDVPANIRLSPQRSPNPNAATLKISYDKSSCDKYLRSKNKYPEKDIPEKDIHTIVTKLLRADPDPNGLNCQWIIDAFLKNQFKLDEDELVVREDILKFKNLFGVRRPLPKDYTEMKKMNREKLDKETKKSLAKSQSKTSNTVFTDCKSFYKNVKNTLPEPYKSYSNEQSDALFKMIENANPAGDFQVCIWIVEEIKRGHIKNEDLNEVKKYLGRYLKLDLPLPNFYPNFPSYSNYQLVKDTVDKKIDLLSTSDLGILLIPLTTETSCYYGAQTSWCTAQRNEDNTFEEYSKKGIIYIWFDRKLKDKFQFHFEESEFKDRDNEYISKQKLDGFMKHPILSVIFNEGIPRTMKNPNGAAIYATQFIKGRWPEAEPYIMKDPTAAVNYAANVIKGRWPEVEPYIMKDPTTAVFYAANVIKGRWPEAEDIIMKDIDSASDYSDEVIKGRWKEVEPYIMKDPKASTYYAINVIKGRWPDEITKDGENLREKAENIIIKEPQYAFQYAKDMIKGRWPDEITKDGKNLREKAENIIMKDPQYAFQYAKDVIKGRWPDAEKYISKDKFYKDLYSIIILRSAYL
jgi:hypothetical protein